MSDNNPTRIAVVGLGKMGIMHAAMVSTVPGAQVAAICDRQKALGHHVGSMGVRAPFYDDFLRMLEAEKPDGVIVSTPQFTHAELATTALEAGIPVLVEKPLAHTLDAARTMRDAALRHPKVPAGCAFMLGHQPIWREAERQLHGGAIGTVTKFEATMRLSQVFSAKKGWIYTKKLSGGGVLINSGSHILHLMLRLFGMPVRVEAEARSHGSTDVEDEVQCSFAYANGATGRLESHWSVRGYPVQSHGFSITGEVGNMQVNDRTLRFEDGEGERHTISEESLPGAAFNLTPFYGGAGYYNEVADFVRAIREGRKPEIGFEEAYEVQRLLEAIYRSAESRKSVALEDVR